MNTEALKDLLFRLADDDLVIGHRNSEWTGIGPVLEEDIAFASMAQDCVGHAQSYYTLIHELGEPDPDRLAFHRSESAFRSCHLVEQPIGDYAFSLIRHFLYDLAKHVRLEALTQSTYKPLAQLADRIRREHKYARMHAITWVKQLAAGSDEARLRLQSALNEAYPMAFGLFEPTDYTEILVAEGVQPHERELQQRWQQLVEQTLAGTGLSLATDFDPSAYMGGRKGYHSEHLGPMLAEMTEVYAIDPEAVW